MKKTYKNKRDFYKAEAERNARNAEFWKKEAEERHKKITELIKPKLKERIKVAWFCTQCRVVAQGTVPKGVNIETCSCLNCGAKSLLAVGKMPFML